MLAPALLCMIAIASPLSADGRPVQLSSGGGVQVQRIGVGRRGLQGMHAAAALALDTLALWVARPAFGGTTGDSEFYLSDLKSECMTMNWMGFHENIACSQQVHATA